MSERRSPILETLAVLYAASTAGRTGTAGRPFSERFERLLTKARCEKGDAYANALADLATADGASVILKKHPKSKDIQRVTVPPSFEAALFARVRRTSPTAERAAWSALWREAAEWPLPGERVEAWRNFCELRAALVQRGKCWSPFRRGKLHLARLQLEVVSRLLAWRQPALLRTASAQVAGSSKFLERSQGALETLLASATDGKTTSFAGLGISDNPRKVLFHGPVRVVLGGSATGYAGLAGASSLADEDISRAESIECSAPRCVTVENETNFHELCRLGSGDLFVHTSYPNRATVQFLKRLPPALDFHHFGDTDPWGFDVLRALRIALAPLRIAPLHMSFRPAPAGSALTDRDRKKLDRLLADPLLADVHDALECMRSSGTKGDFEQERLAVSGSFPYR